MLLAMLLASCGLLFRALAALVTLRNTFVFASVGNSNTVPSLTAWPNPAFEMTRYGKRPRLGGGCFAHFPPPIQGRLP